MPRSSVKPLADVGVNCGAPNVALRSRAITRTPTTASPASSTTRPAIAPFFHMRTTMSLDISVPSEMLCEGPPGRRRPEAPSAKPPFVAVMVNVPGVVRSGKMNRPSAPVMMAGGCARGPLGGPAAPPHDAGDGDGDDRGADGTSTDRINDASADDAVSQRRRLLPGSRGDGRKHDQHHQHP